MPNAMQIHKALSHHATDLPDGQILFRCFNDVLRFLVEVNEQRLEIKELEARISALEAGARAAKYYINRLESCQDIYYHAIESKEAANYRELNP